MKVEDVRPKKVPQAPKDKIRFTLTYKREYDVDFLGDDHGIIFKTTEDVVAYLQNAAKADDASVEDMLGEWDILDGNEFDGGFELDVELIIPGQKRLI